MLEPDVLVAVLVELVSAFVAVGFGGWFVSRSGVRRGWFVTMPTTARLPLLDALPEPEPEIPAELAAPAAVTPPERLTPPAGVTPSEAVTPEERVMPSDGVMPPLAYSAGSPARRRSLAISKPSTIRLTPDTSWTALKTRSRSCGVATIPSRVTVPRFAMRWTGDQPCVAPRTSSTSSRVLTRSCWSATVNARSWSPGNSGSPPGGLSAFAPAVEVASTASIKEKRGLFCTL